MSENKKYFYMRLKENFFESEEMVMLESMPNGFVMSNLLLKMYCRSLKREGKLMITDAIPYSIDTLAMVSRIDKAVVEKALTVFEDLGLIEVLDSGAIYMLSIQDYIGKSSTEADRIREYRQRIDNEK